MAQLRPAHPRSTARPGRSARRLLAGVVGGVLLLVTLGSATGSATAAESDHRFSLYPPSILVLTIARGEEPEPVQRAVMLRCLPRGGDHPAPGAACRALESAHGDFTAMAPGDGFCTMEYRPVTVTSRGVWHGTLVDRTATYGNACALAQATGPVFNF